MLHEINANNLFTVYPSNSDNTMEFFYILKGKIKYENNNKDLILKKGDYFHVHDIEKTQNFNTITDTQLLYVSNQPVFKYMSNDIKELHNIVKKVEKKDIYTHDHGKRVQDYSLKLAKKLNFTPQKFEILGYSALFHDIGKIHVPDKILNKPGPLTDKEYESVKRHPGEGKNMVQETFLKKIGKIIEQHHENLDGSGYPHGLKNDEIKIEAKIIRVVDSYDAMTSDRPYRKGMKPGEAIQELKKYRNVHYDKETVNKFVELLKEEKGVQ